MISSLFETIGRNNPLDYWQLLCGLSLILLAVICHFLARQRNDMPAWRWHAVDMDACLSKPINPNTLFNTTAGIFAVSQPMTKTSEPNIESSSDSSDSNDVFNPSTLMDRIGGDAATFKKLVAMFQTQAPEYVATLATAAASGNLAQIRHEAHTLRGAAANMSADNTARLAGRIETAATQENLESIQPLIEQLKQELVCLKQALYNIPATAPVFKDERINPCAS